MVGRTLCDTYRIIAQLGVGAMGTVYEAEHVRLKRAVAVKVLADRYRQNVAALKRFHNEVRALALLDHPHIVRILDFAVSGDGRPFLVMERLYGTTVGTQLACGHRFSVATTVDIALQVGDALVAAHSKGIVHRDLKPDNLFLCSVPGGASLVKVLDFGISRLPGSEGPRITTDSEVLGTPEYMSPEQARGQNECVNGRADQYGLALVMYEMLSGVSPFAAGDVQESLNKVANEVPPLVSDYDRSVPRSLALVIARAMSKDPSERYPGIDEFMDAVRAVAPSARSRSIPAQSERAPRSMPVAKGKSDGDPVRTIALMLSRARAAFLGGDLATATELATTALDASALSSDAALLAVVEMAEPLLDGVLSTALEPMDRRIVRDTSELRLLSEVQAQFLSGFRPRTSINDAIRGSSLSRLDTLRTLLDLVSLGAIWFRAEIPAPRSDRQLSTAREPAATSAPRALKRA
ncbi:MAG TPA: serine/threonine-protein kinase [Polyangiaceae bacterium]|jgi:serine/threonine-protein kinase|nr:serine/threonine-protein kinase [Polyangiaceae bacterium]